jgi:diguanylate cyclase (GGDEF)-like protein
MRSLPIAQSPGGLRECSRVTQEFDMTYDRSKMPLNGEAEIGLARAQQPRSVMPHPRVDRREVENLRLINARLVREIAVLKEREAQTQKLADRDALTGLYNRRRLFELLDLAIAEAAQQWQCVGLLFIDLNGFKSINDEYGHAAGDKILTTVAARIAARVRTGDIVCRYGGDEFVVVLPNVPDADAAAVSLVADTIRQRVALPYRIDGVEQHLTAAIGESMYPQDGESAEVLLQRADQDMYRLKARLSRPMVSLGSAPQPRPSRRRNDKSKLRMTADNPGGDL